MILYCNASNMHSGGGKTLIIDFINHAAKKKNLKFVFFIDKRLVFSKTNLEHIDYIRVSKFFRIFIDFYLFYKLKKEDILICLGNLPPIISYSCWTVLLQSNRFLVENYTIKHFKYGIKIKILFERYFFRLFQKNISQIIVQSRTMKEILDNQLSSKTISKVKVLAYKNAIPKNVAEEKKKYDFVYIASDETYKNHSNLLKAWVRLSLDKLYPSLCLVLPKNSRVKEKVKKLLSKYEDMHILVLDSNDREEAMNSLKTSKTLIFPSKFESYGLPIVEAKMNNLKIIASEKDYVRDLVDPEETFDPESDLSIYRAVKRFMKKSDEKTKIIKASNFIDYIISKGTLKE